MKRIGKTDSGGVLIEIQNSPCGCGSGKKAKFCCWDKLVKEARRK